MNTNFLKKMLVLPLMGLALTLTACSSDPQDELRDRFNAAAQAFNKKGSQKVDAYTTLWKLSASKEGTPQLTYHYTVNDTILKAQGNDPVATVLALKDINRKNICDHKEIRPTLDQGAKYEYIYTGAGKKELGRFSLTVEDCK